MRDCDQLLKCSCITLFVRVSIFQFTRQRINWRFSDVVWNILPRQSWFNSVTGTPISCMALLCRRFSDILRFLSMSEYFQAMTTTHTRISGIPRKVVEWQKLIYRYLATWRGHIHFWTGCKCEGTIGKTYSRLLSNVLNYVFNASRITNINYQLCTPNQNM